MDWVDEGEWSWRWHDKFAWFPVRTQDAGWIWLAPYSLWEKSWGWGFEDYFPFKHRENNQNGRFCLPKNVK